MLGSKLLLVDIDPDGCLALTEYLEAQGAEVLAVKDGARVLAAIREDSPTLVLLGTLAEGTDVLQLIRELRRESDVPLFLLSAGDGVPDEEVALDLGADAVIEPWLSYSRLVARMRAVLRRSRTQFTRGEGDLIRFDNFEISQERFELRLGGKKVDIPPKELQLL